MVEKLPLPKDNWALNWELTVKDTTFSWLILYRWIHEYLKEKGWKDIQTGDDNYEIFYSDLENADGSKNQTIWFRASKDPLGGGNGYLRLFFKLDMVTLLVKTKEVMHKGQKVKLNDGEFKFKCSLWFAEEQDAGKGSESEWNKNSILRFFKFKFWNRIHPTKIAACKGELMKYSNELYNYIQMYAGAMPPSGPKEYYSSIKGTEN